MSTATIAAMIDGAVSADVVKPTKLARLLRRRAVRSERNQARRLLERGAKIEVATLLSEAEEALRPLAQQRDTVGVAESAWQKAEATLEDLRSQLATAHQGVDAAVAAGNDHEAMLGAADRERSLRRLVDIAEQQERDKAETVNRLRSDFDEGAYEVAAAKVERLTTASASPKLALEYVAEQAERADRMMSQELSAQMQGYAQAMARITFPGRQQAALNAEAAYAREHQQPRVSQPPMRLADVVELLDVPPQPAPASVPLATKTVKTARKTKPVYLDTMMTGTTRKAARKRKARKNAFITK